MSKKFLRPPPQYDDSEEDSDDDEVLSDDDDDDDDDDDEDDDSLPEVRVVYNVLRFYERAHKAHFFLLFLLFFSLYLCGDNLVLYSIITNHMTQRQLAACIAVVLMLLL